MKRLFALLAHQRAKSEDFQPRNVKNRAKILECLFSDSQLDIKGGISLGNLGCKPYVSPYMTMDLTPLRAVVDYEEVVRPLRIRLLSLPKEPFILGNQPFTEIQW
ncbi:unnamed protein product [Brugia pahangi]|uniref:Serine/threonine-protein kinase ATR n=1 Tax=Brugia pahangi TaxID=6280 RepID=A0A0N4TGZ4_BRUPA|nr:unnamed protein product [Brugia pahangi]